MSDFETLKSAVLRELYAVGATPDNPINLLEIGPTLVAAGYEQHAIVYALDGLVADKCVEYAGGNRVRVTRPA